MPLSGGGSATGTPIGSMGILATTPGNVDTGYTWTYATQAKVFPAYTPNPQGTAYVVGVLNLLAAAQGTDVNALRIAVENLRVFTENLAQQHNAISIALRSAGLISN